MTYRPPHLPDLQDLSQWADRTTSRAELPNLVRRLIKATNDSVVVLDMGGGEDVDHGGYDGLVFATRGTPMVPEGSSVWEMGVGDPGDKAQDDYRERTRDPRGVSPRETTFVFVTPRHWPGGRDWQDRRRAEGVWKNVVACDAADLLSAMESAPAVQLRFAEEIGKPASGIRTLREWWDKYSTPCDGLLTPELVLAGRVDQASQLLRILDNEETAQVWISAPGMDDVMAFVAASLFAGAAQGSEELLDRALVVYEPGAFRFLEDASRLLILLPFDESLVRHADLTTGHTVIIHTATAAGARLVLPRVPPNAAEEVLLSAGVESGRASALALDVYRSIERFHATLRGAPPVSSRAAVAALCGSATLRRLWLLGSWSSGRTGDAELVQSIIVDGSDPEELLNPLVESPDPVFSRVGASRKVIDVTAHFEAVAERLTLTDMSAFERVVQDVLGAIDPTLATPLEDRWKASLFGPARLYSGDLRRGVARTVAALGAFGDKFAVPGGPTLRGWAELAVRAVLVRANEDPSGDLWISLGDVLPLLAEAAPDEFLTALGEALEAESPFGGRLFQDSSSGLGASSPHVEVQWALEVVAWSPDHVARAVSLLAQMAEQDPGGRLSNRPAEALTAVFRPWLPQTSAGLAERERVLDGLLRRLS